MTAHYSAETKGVLNATGPVVLGDASVLGGKVHALIGTIDLSVETVVVGDTIVWGRLPKGAVPLMGVLTASATMGASATLDVGTDTTAAKFRAAATFTTANTPTFYGKAAAIGVPLTDRAKVQSVIAVADLPTSGTLTNVLFYTTPDSN